MTYINIGRPNPHFKPDTFELIEGVYRKVSTGHRLRNWDGSIKIEESIWIAAICGKHQLVLKGQGFNELGIRFDLWQCAGCGTGERRYPNGSVHIPPSKPELTLDDLRQKQADPRGCIMLASR